MHCENPPLRGAHARSISRSVHRVLGCQQLAGCAFHSRVCTSLALIAGLERCKKCAHVKLALLRSIYRLKSNRTGAPRKAPALSALTARGTRHVLQARRELIAG